MKTNLGCSGNDFARCPLCGHDNDPTDMFERGLHDEEVHRCAGCDEEITVVREVSVTYTVYVPDEKYDAIHNPVSINDPTAGPTTDQGNDVGPT